MAVENLVDNYYQLHVSTDDGSTFTKVAHLLRADPPINEKLLDDVTATDDRHTVMAVVDFRENTEIEASIVYDPTDTTHQAIQTAFDDNLEYEWQLKFVEATGLSRQFKAMVSKLSPDTDTANQKTRLNMTLTITSLPEPIA